MKRQNRQRGRQNRCRGGTIAAGGGRKCQKWTADFPHKEAKDVPTGEGLGNHAYCRDPDSTGEPWCYSMDPKVGKEVCGVEKCTQTGVWARDFAGEADDLATGIGSTDCDCGAQLYGDTTTTKDTSVAGTSFLQHKRRGKMTKAGCDCE